jgi:uncharacterized protein with GYD domain
MPLYMSQFSYTKEAWAALAQNPEDRSVAIGELLESMGGRLVSLYFTFGEYDGFLVFEAPNENDAAAIMVAAISPGHLKAIKTTLAFTPEEAMEFMRKAGAATYRGPGG